VTGIGRINLNVDAHATVDYASLPVSTAGSSPALAEEVGLRNVHFPLPCNVRVVGLLWLWGAVVARDDRGSG